jgi:hypothetical protein
VLASESFDSALEFLLLVTFWGITQVLAEDEGFPPLFPGNSPFFR